jgi:hypothetical protein
MVVEALFELAVLDGAGRLAVVLPQAATRRATAIAPARVGCTTVCSCD